MRYETKRNLESLAEGIGCAIGITIVVVMVIGIVWAIFVAMPKVYRVASEYEKAQAVCTDWVSPTLEGDSVAIDKAELHNRIVNGWV